MKEGRVQMYTVSDMKYKKWVCFAGLFVIAVIAGKDTMQKLREK